MKPSTSFLLGVAAGVFAVILVDRARKLIREEDVEALRDRISAGLKNLEGTVAGLAEGLSESLAESME